MAMYPYDPEVDKPIFDEYGNVLKKIPTSRKKFIYTRDGEKLSKVTLNIPQKSGFGDPELNKKINRVGRPKGSKSKTKSTFESALQLFESHQIESAQRIVAVMMGDEEKAGGEIKTSDIISASKYIIEAPHKMKKSQEDPRSNTGFTGEDSKDQEEEDQERPLISLTIES